MDEKGLLLKYFVLKPGGNDAYAMASRAAMSAYATLIDQQNPALAKDLREWILREEARAKGE